MISNVERYRKVKVTQGTLRIPEMFVSIYFQLSLSLFRSPITVRNGGHFPGLGNESAKVFSDAIVGDGFAIDRTI